MATPAPDLHTDGLDRKALREARERFRGLNAARLLRARSLLAPRAQQFLDALPLLLHINHPALPGYAGADLPCGLSGWTPGRQHAEAATALARGFSLHKLPDDRADIHAVYAMGSLGSLAQSRDSDFDIWVCAPQPVLDALAPKLDGISRWAANEGLAVTLFPVDPAAWRRGERDSAMSGEDCGSTQQQLLLDEFYRSHLLLGGRYPLWWLVPPGDDEAYAAFTGLVHERRYLPADETLDFGNVARLPEEEFLGASLWQLSKALDAPEKSLLKLMLVELHATRGEPPLSQQLKALVHDDTPHPDLADAYFLMFSAIARHLEDDPARLELARRCLVARATAPVPVREDWRREFVGRLAKAWGWPRARVVASASNSLSLGDLREEQRELQRQLERSHQLLRQLTARNGTTPRVSPEDLQLLEGRLRAQLERRAGKLERLPRGLRRRLGAEPLLLRQRGLEAWHLTTLAEQDVTVYSCSALPEVLAWLQVNGLLGRGVPLHVLAEDESAVRRTLNRLQELLPEADLREPDADAWLEPAQPARVLLLVNPGLPAGTGKDLAQDGPPTAAAMVSAREDSLRFSGFHQNLVQAAAAVQLNTWGEVSCTTSLGDDALPETLCQVLDWLPTRDAAAALQVAATAPGRQELTAVRVQELLTHIHAALAADPAAVYVFELGNDFIAIWHDGERHRWQHDANRSRLLASTTRGRGLQVDQRATRLAATARLLPLLPARGSALLLDTQDPGAPTLLRDTDGSIWEFTWPERPPRELVTSLALFLLNVAPRAAVPDARRPVLHLCRDGRALAVQPPDLRLPLPVQAVRMPGADAGSPPRWDLVCDGQHFPGLTLDRRGVQPFVRHVLARRASGGRYPVHVTDLDLRLPTPPGRLAPYLVAKRELERVLAAALASA